MRIGGRSASLPWRYAPRSAPNVDTSSSVRWRPYVCRTSKYTSAIGANVTRMHSALTARPVAMRRRSCGARHQGVEREDHGRHGQEIQVVAVRQPLHDEGGRERREREPRSRFEVLVQAEQREGHPARHQHLQVADLAQPRRSEGENCAREDRRVLTRRQTPGEAPHPDGRQRERRDEGDVVGDKRAAGEPHNRGDGYADAEQVFGKRQRVAIREEDRGVPQSSQAVAEAVGVPSENPRVQQRIAEIARQRFVEMEHQRPGHPQAQQEETRRNRKLSRSLHRPAQMVARSRRTL